MKDSEDRDRICDNCKVVFEGSDIPDSMIIFTDNLCDDCAEEQEESGEYDIDFLDTSCDCPYCTGELPMEIY